MVRRDVDLLATLMSIALYLLLIVALLGVAGYNLWTVLGL